MLIGISPLLSPELLKILCEMGHGDELVLADAHFPGHSVNARTLRADGLGVAPLLAAIAPLWAVEETVMMQTDTPDELDHGMESEYMQALAASSLSPGRPERVPRAEFYARAARAFCVLITGELRPYGNIVLRKGVTP